MSTLCRSCRFACQQRVLKTLPGPGYPCSGDIPFRVSLFLRHAIKS